MKRIKDQIDHLKKAYRFEILGEFVTNRIGNQTTLCADTAGNIYLNTGDTSKTHVFDQNLNKMFTFEQRFPSTSMVVTDSLIITANWKENQAAIYDKQGVFVRKIKIDKEIAPNMLPFVVCNKGNQVNFLDFRTNIIYFTHMKEDSSFEVIKSVVIKDKIFYNPELDTWPCLRGLTEYKGNLYTAGDEIVWQIEEDGSLKKYSAIPFKTQSILGLTKNENYFCVVDNVFNCLYMWRDDHLKKVKKFKSSEGLLSRLCSWKEYVYMLKILPQNRISVMKVLI